MKIVMCFLIFFGIAFADISNELILLRQIQGYNNYIDKLKIKCNCFENEAENQNKIIKIYHKLPVVIAPNLVLQVICKIVTNNKCEKKVVLNNRWYKIGDVVKGYKILQIYNNGVDLKYKNKILQIRIIPQNILKVVK